MEDKFPSEDRCLERAVAGASAPSLPSRRPENIHVSHSPNLQNALSVSIRTLGRLSSGTRYGSQGRSGTDGAPMHKQRGGEWKAEARAVRVEIRGDGPSADGVSRGPQIHAHHVRGPR